MPKKKLPHIQFYPGDWLKEPTLLRCSKAAKGMWIDMLCLMHECEDRGVLATGGKPWSDEDIAAAVTGDTTANLALLTELLDKGVTSRNSTGAVYSRRMVREEQVRRVRAIAGSKGGKQTVKQNSSKRVSKTQANSDSDSDIDTSSPEGGDARGGNADAAIELGKSLEVVAAAFEAWLGRSATASEESSLHTIALDVGPERLRTALDYLREQKKKPHTSPLGLVRAVLSSHAAPTESAKPKTVTFGRRAS